MKKILGRAILGLSLFILLFGMTGFAEKPSVYLSCPSGEKGDINSLSGFRRIIRDFDNVSGLVCSSGGNLYVGNPWTGEIESYSQSGEPKKKILEANEWTTGVGHLLLSNEGDLFFTAGEGNLWKIEGADSDNPPKLLGLNKHFIGDRFPPDFAFLTTGKYRGDITVASHGEDNDKVVRLSGPGFFEMHEFITPPKSVGDGDSIKQNEFAYPTNIAVGPDGNVYVGERRKILKYSNNGEFLEVFAGDFPTTSLKIGPNNLLYATTNRSLRKYKLDGTQRGIVHYPDLWGNYPYVVAIAVCE